ncbi:MAG: hypothetical protein QM484_04185, partial [Woeseiaceae bacterium]
MNNQRNFYHFLSFSNTALFFVLFFLLPLIYTHQVFETASLPRHILIASIACLFLFVFSIQLFLHKKNISFTPLHVGLLVFLCFALLSSLWSVDIKNSIIELTQLSAYFIIAFFASQLNNEKIKIIFTAIF